ncbi:hypothetical protein, partial [Bradyrhizobium diazoefficiens]|uniref:hypothetical protein n=1 Tax=Bradyrhizobium diazoefficiens TaxID=1355477 RepID=UPI001B8D86F3
LRLDQEKGPSTPFQRPPYHSALIPGIRADLFRAAVLIKTGAIASQELRRASDGEVSIEERFNPTNKTGVRHSPARWTY